LIGYGLHSDPSRTDWITILFRIGYLCGSALLIVGLLEYVERKGRDTMWALWAAFSLLGLLILVCLEDRSKPKTGL
jgi:hypothetical protein